MTPPVGGDLSDPELAARAARGDDDAFAELVRRHERRVFNLALRMLGRPEDARDASQDAFVSCYRNLSKFRGDAAFSTWLHRIAVNACYDVLRRRRDLLGMDEAPEPLPAPDHGDAVTTSLDVRRALLAVPEEFRTVLVLHDIQDLGYDEIADRNGQVAPAPGPRRARTGAGGGTFGAVRPVERGNIMSDRHSSRSGAPGDHPEEALAGFVDGTLPDDERRLVEAHVRTCATCRDEVDLARASLSATAGLPEADAPGLDAAAIAETARTVVPMRARARAADSSERSGRLLAVIGSLAAAAIAGVFVVGLLRGPGGGGSATTGALAPSVTAVPPQPTEGFQAGPSAGVAPSPVTGVAVDENFTPASVARSLAGGSDMGLLQPRAGARRLRAHDVAVTTLCAQGAVGTAERPALLVRATFEGRPAFVTAFRAPGSPNVRVVVTSARTCSVLYQTQYPAPGASPSG